MLKMKETSIRDLIPLQKAFEASVQSPCLKRKVGAVLVSAGDIVSRECNRYPFRRGPCTRDSPCFSGREERQFELERDFAERKPLAPELRALLSASSSPVPTRGTTLWTREELTLGSGPELIAAGIETVRIYGKCPVRRMDEHSEEVRGLEEAGVRVVQKGYLEDFWYDPLPWQGDSDTGETMFSALLVSPKGDVVGRAVKQSTDKFVGYLGNSASCGNVCAERMAIYDCLKRDPTLLTDACLYTTYEPCYFCALVIVEIGLGRVVYSTSANDGHLGIAMLKEKGVHVDRIDYDGSSLRITKVATSEEGGTFKRTRRKSQAVGSMSD